MEKDLEEYKKYVSSRLAGLIPVFARASIGDFSQKLEIPDEDDQFTELYTGIEIMLEVIQEQLQKLNNLNTSLTKNLEELNATKTQMEEEKNLDEAILESIGDGVVVTDRKLNITLVNLQAQQMLGFREIDVLNKPLGAFLHAVDSKLRPIPEGQRSTFLALSQKKKHSLNYFYLKADGAPLPVSVTSAPILFGDLAVGAVVVFKDRTKEQKVDEMKNEFISLAAHQLRSPLSVMRWNMELFRKQNSYLSLKEKDKIESIYKNIQKMIALVNDMLSVSKIDQGRAAHVVEPVDPVIVIKEIIDELRIIYEKKMVEIWFQPTSVAKVMADKKKLHDVILNMIDNAIKFCPPLGKIEIKLQNIKDRVVLEFSDTGIGIPAEDGMRIFERFYRASNATSIGSPGTGLGLFLVKSYVEAWGGKIWFESPANLSFLAKVGKIDNPGTSFYIELMKAEKRGDR